MIHQSASSLNLKGFTDGSNWIDLHMKHGELGFLVDFHITMEHINASIDEVQVMRQLGKIKKIDVGSLSQGLAMTSFERSVPKFFHNYLI
jgi:hypothetical protein